MTIHKYFNITLYSLGKYEYVIKIIKSIDEIIGYNIFTNIITNQSYDYRTYKSLKYANVDDDVIIIDDRSDVWNVDNVQDKLYVIKAYNYFVDMNDNELFIIMNKILKYFNINDTVKCNKLLNFLKNKDLFCTK
jgi:hypothetical protein